LKAASSFSLITYCAAATLVTALAFALLFAGGTLLFAAASALTAEAQAADPPPELLFAGVITDERCGAQHRDHARSSADCARMCVRNGSSYSVINGDKTYRLTGMYDQLDEVAGQRVKISGTRAGSALKVDRITPESSTQP